MFGEISEQLVEAAVLLAVGMSVVFVFLVVLIGATKLITIIANALPEEELAPSTQSRSHPIKQGAVPAGTLAAITAAIHQYRNNK